MTESIEQIALRVAKTVWTDLPAEWFNEDRKGRVKTNVVEFARRLVAELTKGQEPYGYLYFDKHMQTQFSHQHPDIYKQFNMDCKPVFAAPIPATCPTCTQNIDDAAKAGRIVDDREDYKSRALLYERTNAEQAAMLNQVIADRDGLMEALIALVDYDSYETEYDGRMYSICPSCGKQDLDDHRPDCEFSAARAAIAKVQP